MGAGLQASGSEGDGMPHQCLRKPCSRGLLAGVLLLAFAWGAGAQEAVTEDAPDGAFGFADDSGVTSPGAYQATLDFMPSGSTGALAGRDLGGRVEINTGLMERVQLGAALSGIDIRNSPIDEPRSAARNFVFSLPGKWQWRARDVNDFGAALLFEPYLGRQNNQPPPGALTYGLDTKIALDGNLHNQIYATLNIGYVFQRTVPSFGASENVGQVYVSLAGTYRLLDRVFLGAQIRQVWQYSHTDAVAFNGQALSIGPTLSWQVSDMMTLSAVYLRQVAGQDPTRPNSALELTDFRANEGRVRLTLSF